MFNIIQTFYVNKDAVQGADSILVTSIDLYVKAKPNDSRNSSGIVNPGITVSLCDVNNEVPDVSKEYTGIARLEYGSIFALSDGSVPSTFVFNQPISVVTDRYYGIVITFDDSDYQLWTNKFGDRLIGTNDPSPGSTQNRDGSYFQATNTDGSTMKAITDTDLKYTVKIAKYDQTTIDIDLVNKDYEFFTTTTRAGTWTGGEYVFANTAPLPGSVSVAQGNSTVTGLGTIFENIARGQYLVLKSDNTYDVAQVERVANSTSLTLTTPVSFTNTIAIHSNGLVGTVQSADYISNQLVLINSTANTSIKFTNGTLLRGETSNTTAIVGSVDNLPVDRFVSQINVVSQSSSTSTLNYNISHVEGSNYVVDANYNPLPTNASVDIGQVGRLIVSRSNEIGQGQLYDNNKSAVVKMSFTSNNSFNAPYIRSNDTDIIITRNNISNTHTSSYANGVSYDTEVYPTGIALSKHFTTKITFDKDRRAEDLRVYCTAYRPVGTDVLLYARIHNDDDNETFDDKLWTPLEVTAKGGTYSSTVDKSDVIEFEYGLPSAPEAIATISGSFTASLNSNTLVGVGTPDLTQLVTIGRPINLYSAYFPDNNFVAFVTGVTPTTITLNTPVTYVGVVGSGMKVNTLKYGQTAFNNGTNSNIVRYFNSTGSVFDEYTTLQIKVVLLANQTHIIPSVDTLQVIAVSA